MHQRSINLHEVSLRSTNSESVFLSINLLSGSPQVHTPPHGHLTLMWLAEWPSSLIHLIFLSLPPAFHRTCRRQWHRSLHLLHLPPLCHLRRICRRWRSRHSAPAVAARSARRLGRVGPASRGRSLLPLTCSMKCQGERDGEMRWMPSQR